MFLKENPRPCALSLASNSSEVMIRNISWAASDMFTIHVGTYSKYCAAEPSPLRLHSLVLFICLVYWICEIESCYSNPWEPTENFNS